MDFFRVRLPDMSKYVLVRTSNLAGAQDAMCEVGGYSCGRDGLYLVADGPAFTAIAGGEVVNDEDARVAWIQQFQSA